MSSLAFVCTKICTRNHLVAKCDNTFVVFDYGFISDIVIFFFSSLLTCMTHIRRQSKKKIIVSGMKL